MRILLVLLMIVVIALIAAITTGFIDIGLVRKAEAPRIHVEGGQIPAFDVKTPTVSAGITKETIALPTVSVRKPDPQPEQPEQNQQDQ